MKHLIVICATAIAIAALTNVAWVINTDIREYSRIQVETFRAYAREKAKQKDAQAQKQALGPQVEIPTERLENL